MATYSHSRIGSFETCPLQYNYKYIEKVKTDIEESVEMFLGKRVHETLEKIYKDLKFQTLNTLQELLDFYNEEWNKNWNDAIVIVRDQYNSENYRQMGEKFITDYYERYKPFNQSKTLGLETQDRIALNDKYEIHVRIDRLSMREDGVYEIHDYKTASSLPTQEKADKDRQLAIYAYGIKKLYPDAKKIKLIWHYLAFDKEIVSERTEEQLETLRKDVLESIRQIESCTDFCPKESALCNWCQFRPICPLFKHLYELEHKDADEYLKDDGVTLVNKYSKAYEESKAKGEELEKIKQALIDYSKQENIDVIYGSDIKAKVSSYQKKGYPSKHTPEWGAFVDMIKKAGLFEQLQTVDMPGFTKMIDSNQIPDEILKLFDKFISKNDVVNVRLSKK